MKETRPEIALKMLVEQLKKGLYPYLAIPKRLLNEVEAASYLGLSVYTVRAWRKKGHGPEYYKIGTRVLYHTNDLDLFIKQYRISRNKDGKN